MPKRKDIRKDVLSFWIPPCISALSAAALRRLRSQTRLRARFAEVLHEAKRSNAAETVRKGPVGNVLK